MTKYQNVSKSEAVRHGTIAPRRQRSKKEKQEFGLAKKEYIVCPDCSAVYFDKAWHHALEEDLGHLREDKNIQFKICPACRMKRDKIFEGELVINMASIAPKTGEEIMKIIENSDKQAQDKDPLDRILWIEKDKKEIRVFTSENQLAVRMGKKLKSSIKGSTIKIARSHEEDVIRVYWKY